MAFAASPVAQQQCDAFFDAPTELRNTLALVVLVDGVPVLERYGVNSMSGEPIAAETKLISWSMAKSVTHALVGLAVADGLLDLEAPAPVSAWRNDDRRNITLQQLLNMRSGLAFREDYVDSAESDVVTMLFKEGKDDVAAFAAAFPLEHQPGSFWSYSSGTTNIICRILGDAIGGGEEGMRAYLTDRLFAPIGITDADPHFDAAGTFIGSSFLYLTAGDFCRFGELYRNDGCDPSGTRVLPAGWVDHARTPTPTPDTEAHRYGAHWWLWQYPGSFAAHGYQGQHLIVVPDRRLTVLRLANTPDELKAWPRALLHRLIEAFPVRV
jgi:CubicO group peptidase (beta-lactamase class C family)